MKQIKIKRVYEPAELTDGFRILVDKMWPRGIRKENLHLDLWEKEIAPSTQLREWFHEDTGNRWEEFSKRYIKELENSPEIKNFLEKVKDKEVITLLYASKNETENNAVVLKGYLKDKII